jgi:hypothetical protein
MSLTLSGDSPKISADSTGVLTSGTAKTASGTSVNFTDIPSWVKRITVMFNGVSTNGSSNILLRLGTSGGVETTGYAATNTSFSASALGSANRTDGFEIGGVGAADVRQGQIIICNLSSNLWTISGYTSFSSSVNANIFGGSKTTTATLDRIRITTVNGTDTFDAGSINILYE